MCNGRAFRVGLAVLAAAAVGGCDATLTLQRYPAFYDPALKSVAVAPFANATLRAEAGDFLANRLAEALKANGTYEVVGPAELKASLAAADIALPANADTEAVLAALRKLGGIQAVITGTVKGFSTDHGSYVEVDDWYSPAYGAGYWRYGYWHHGYYGGISASIRRYSYTYAYVSATAGMVLVADGKTIHATPAPLAARLRSHPDVDRTGDEVLAETAAAVAARLVEEFAVVPWELKVSPGKVVRTARPGKDGQLEFTNDFRPDDEQMVVVLHLPAEADRNTFRLAIAPKKGEGVLVEETITWSAADRTRRFVFSPRKLAEGAKGDDFEVRLYVGDELALKRGFEIEN
ncbi:MAG: hypothetical protein WBF17_05470 [Phycisphaerae bacterium]